MRVRQIAGRIRAMAAGMLRDKRLLSARAVLAPEFSGDVPQVSSQSDPAHSVPRCRLHTQATARLATAVLIPRLPTLFMPQYHDLLVPQGVHLLDVARRAAGGEFASLGALRAAMHAQSKRIRLALRREAVQLAEKECAALVFTQMGDVLATHNDAHNDTKQCLPYMRLVYLLLSLWGRGN